MRTVSIAKTTNPDPPSRGTPMRRMLISIFCSIVLATVFVAGARAQHRGVKFAAEVPLLDCDGMPCVEARMGTGPNLKMGIDTGNVDSVLDAAYADAAGLKSTAPLPAGAPAGMFRTMLPSISVGSVKLTNVGTLALGLSDMIAQHQMPNVD